MERGAIREGMTIHSADGEKLGKVVRCDADSFLIEKGLFFKKDYLARYEDVERVEGDEARLNASASAFRVDEDVAATGGVETTAQTGANWPAQGAAPIGRQPERTGARGGTEEARIPLVEEELQIQKTRHAAGEVQVGKRVVEEHRQVTVPVQREELVVERVPADRRSAAGEAPIGSSETVTVALEEEEIEVRKRPVVREEVRVSKEIREEPQTVTATTRREELDVEGPEGTRPRSRDDDPNTRR